MVVPSCSSRTSREDSGAAGSMWCRCKSRDALLLLEERHLVLPHFRTRVAPPRACTHRPTRGKGRLALAGECVDGGFIGTRLRDPVPRTGDVGPAMDARAERRSGRVSGARDVPYAYPAVTARFVDATPSGRVAVRPREPALCVLPARGLPDAALNSSPGAEMPINDRRVHPGTSIRSSDRVVQIRRSVHLASTRAQFDNT